MKLPKIKDSYNAKINEQLFLTTSDDIGFALGQLQEIGNRISIRRNRGLKLWDKSKNNNIYTSYENKSKMLIKARKENKNKSKSSDWKKQSIFNKTEISEIEESDEIIKNVKNKYELKYKYKDRDRTISDFVSTKNETFMANTMIRILKDRHSEMIKTQDDYSRSLRHEILLLDKDINKFDDLIMSNEKEKKEDEEILDKHIVKTKNLVNLYKMLLQEYNSTTHEIYKILMTMNEFQLYAKFIHKLLGGDNDILHCELIENMNFKDFKTYDIYSITQRVLKKTKNLLKTQEKRDFKNEIHNFDLSFKDMEDKLVKLFFEKYEYTTEIKDIIKEGGIIESKRKEKYDLLNDEYEKLLSELNESIKEYNKISLTKEEEEIIKFNYALLIEIYSFLFPKSGAMKNIKDLKVENANDLKSDIVSPIFSEIDNLEKRVNGLLKKMDNCSSENNELFQHYLNKRKNENRALKLLQEKNIIKMNEEIHAKKYNDKMRKIIIKNRYKYNVRLPNKNIKIKANKKVKTAINLDDLNYLYF